MGYSIYIGEAKAGIDFYEDEVYVYPDVEIVELENAPSLPNDDLTGKSNYRAPSYTTWSNFTKEADLYNMFFDKSEGLMREHPGCFIINKEHLNKIKDSIKKRKSMSNLPPGFEGFNYKSNESFDVGKYDSTLARLLWLEFWFEWALENFIHGCLQFS